MIINTLQINHPEFFLDILIHQLKNDWLNFNWKFATLVDDTAKVIGIKPI